MRAALQRRWAWTAVGVLSLFALFLTVGVLLRMGYLNEVAGNLLVVAVLVVRLALWNPARLSRPPS